MNLLLALLVVRSRTRPALGSFAVRGTHVLCACWLKTNLRSFKVQSPFLLNCFLSFPLEWHFYIELILLTNYFLVLHGVFYLFEVPKYFNWV